MRARACVQAHSNPRDRRRRLRLLLLLLLLLASLSKRFTRPWGTRPARYSTSKDPYVTAFKMATCSTFPPGEFAFNYTGKPGIFRRHTRVRSGRGPRVNIVRRRGLHSQLTPRLLPSTPLPPRRPLFSSLPLRWSSSRGSNVIGGRDNGGLIMENISAPLRGGKIIVFSFR